LPLLDFKSPVLLFLFKMNRILIFGPGWLGKKFQATLDTALSQADITDLGAVEAALEEVKPEVVINTAGKTGHPNIDWCEDNKRATIHSNITGPLVLNNACQKRGIRFVHLSSGCIFTGDSPQPGGFQEGDEPIPVSFYAWTKAEVEKILQPFPVLILRLRMPVDNAPSPRNLITKLSRYPKVIDVINSITMVPDLIKAADQLIQKGRTGIYNVVNPDPVRHSQILALYKEIVDPSHTSNCSIAAGR